MVAHICNPSTPVADAKKALPVPGQPGLQSELMTVRRMETIKHLQQTSHPSPDNTRTAPLRCLINPRLKLLLQDWPQNLVHSMTTGPTSNNPELLSITNRVFSELTSASSASSRGHQGHPSNLSAASKCQFQNPSPTLQFGLP